MKFVVKTTVDRYILIRMNAARYNQDRDYDVESRRLYKARLKRIVPKTVD